jgi:hypothetical protein
LKTLACCGVSQTLQENTRGGLIALAGSEVKNEFRISFDGDECVLIA